MTKAIPLFLLLLLSLIQYNTYSDKESLQWDGPVVGIIVLAIICCILAYKIVRQIHHASKSLGLPSKLPKTPYDMLPAFSPPMVSRVAICRRSKRVRCLGPETHMGVQVGSVTTEAIPDDRLDCSNLLVETQAANY